MYLRILQLAMTAALFLAAGLLDGVSPPRGPVEFRPHVIEPKIPGGYAVAAVDINKDGKPDIIGVSQRVPALAWYENPTWERHVMAEGMTGIVNFAAADIGGDGILEIAVESSFSMVPAKSEGLVWLLRHQGDPRKLWRAELVDKVTTSHHAAWMDIEGDGKRDITRKGRRGSVRATSPSALCAGNASWQQSSLGMAMRSSSTPRAARAAGSGRSS